MAVVVVYLLIKLVLLGLGIGIGFLLHWLLPTVDLGVGILIGVVTTAATVHFFLRAMIAIGRNMMEEVYSLAPNTPRRKPRQKREKPI